MKILLAADGSSYTQAAARYLARFATGLPERPEIHVLHVQPPLPYEGRARAVLGKEAIERYEREESDVALAVAERELHDAPADCRYAWQRGPVAESIARYARENGIDRVVIGSRGLGNLGGVLLGSVAQAVMREVEVPVLVVPRACLENHASAAAA